MTKKRLLLASLVLVALSALLPLLNITLPFGNPNLGSAPSTLAALYLPWPVGVLCGLVKGLAASLATGRWLVEFPSGVGDALAALFTWWLARQVRSRSLTAFLGQLSRYVFTSGVIALTVSLLVATGTVPVKDVAVAAMTASFLPDFAAVWKTISYPAITISISFNAAVVLLVVLIFGKQIERLTAPREPAPRSAS